jgi:5-methylcytosine-specific restriction endonuclease McrA
MQARRYLRPSEKQELWEQQGCQCANPACCAPLTLGEVQWDHVRPLWAGGTNEENWQGLCADCHREKTRREATERAKADRQRRKHEEGRGRKRKGKPIQSRGFDGRWRKKLNGEVVRRDD